MCKSNYVFDYFNDYLPKHEQKAKKLMNTNKIEKYRSRIRQFSPEVQNWLIDLYSKHYNLLHFTLRHVIDKDAYFLLSYSEEDFKNTAVVKPARPSDFINYPDFKVGFSQKENLFDIDNLYRNISKKPFIADKKQELLTLIVYNWTSFFNDTSIWEICLDVLWPDRKPYN